MDADLITVFATSACGVLTAAGGWDAWKWWLTRRSRRKIADAEGRDSEFSTLSNVNVFLQTQLKEKEERFAEQTAALRESQKEAFAEKDARHAAELELVSTRCRDAYCPWREPPNAGTPALPDKDRNEWMRLHRTPCSMCAADGCPNNPKNTKT